MKTSVTSSGPLFDGTATRVTQKATEKAVTEVGEQAEERVKQNLSGVLKNPSGFYRSRINRTGNGLTQEVTDSKVIYGNWLEGTGSRNRTTRFKGYNTFRRTAQQMQREAPRIANQIIGKEIARLN